MTREQDEAYAKRLDEMTRHLLTKQPVGRVKVPTVKRARASASNYVAEFNRVNKLKG